MARYASGKHAFGQCDRCGFRYRLWELKRETNNLNMQNVLVCPECFDPDHPQNKLGRLNFEDNQALRNPRPDIGEYESRYGDSILYEFTDDIDGWFATRATITHDPAGYLNYVWDNENDTWFLYGNFLYDAESYPIVRMRIRIKDPMALSRLWEGQIFWERSIDLGFSGSRQTKIPQPAWSMGDPWVELVWDLAGITDWDGSITALRFDIYGVDFSSGEFDVDWIRIERAY